MNNKLMTKRIILGITGGIAAYKCPDLIRQLVVLGAQVQVILTDGGAHFVTPTTLQALSGERVLTDGWDAQPIHGLNNAMPHINLTRHADAIVIAPATAHCIAQLAHGLANDLLSTLCLGKPASLPLIIAPAMNCEMWEHPATQRNIQQLIADGAIILGPTHGVQACGEIGLGRMIEPTALIHELQRVFTPPLMSGQHIVITAGATREMIDPIRAITNISSGKMGVALAQAAWQMGGQVTLITGEITCPVPYGVTHVEASSAQAMCDSVLQHAPQTDIFISVAAVADWYVKQSTQHKIKKQTVQSEHPLQMLEWSETPDIVATLATWRRTHKPAMKVIGFAAETDMAQLENYAVHKLEKKHLDMIVANRADTAMGSDHNELFVYAAAQTTSPHYKHYQHFPYTSKNAIAIQLMEYIYNNLVN
jgi:phosphopantothenoylcysteine decarboxylase/phosphopantothenate--cysteine ligase